MGCRRFLRGSGIFSISKGNFTAPFSQKRAGLLELSFWMSWLWHLFLSCKTWPFSNSWDSHLHLRKLFNDIFRQFSTAFNFCVRGAWDTGFWKGSPKFFLVFLEISSTAIYQERTSDSISRAQFLDEWSFNAFWVAINVFWVSSFA